VESLSAGFWYVAIDFQLYGLLVLLAAACAACRATRPTAPARLVAIVLAMVLSSLLVWNRSPRVTRSRPTSSGPTGWACWRAGCAA
jgi:hypothetical protein